MIILSTPSELALARRRANALAQSKRDLKGRRGADLVRAFQAFKKARDAFHRLPAFLRLEAEALPAALAFADYRSGRNPKGATRLRRWARKPYRLPESERQS